MVSVNSSCTTGKCCWRGTTSKCCDSLNGGYSGCNRTVCTRSAANTLCANLNYGNLDWRLPTRDELATFDTNSIGIGINGLMICSNAVCTSQRRFDGLATCAQVDRCYGTEDSLCEPANIWAQNRWSGGMSLTGLYFNNFYSNNAFSVRCVAELKN